MCVSRPTKILRNRTDANSLLITDQPLSATRISHNTLTVRETEITQELRKDANSKHMSYVFQKQVHVWILPLSLSQSKFGGRKKPSSACTIITVQIAHDFLKYNFAVPFKQTNYSQALPSTVMEVMINAIIDGNDTHGKAMNARRNGFVGELAKENLTSDLVIDPPYLMCNVLLKKPFRDTFTVPEAIRVHRPEMHEIDYKCFVGPFIPNLIRALMSGIESDYLSNLNRLVFGVLAFERAMSYIYDRPTDTICLIDTHMHFQGQVGSVIASSALDDLEDFLITTTKCVFQEVFKNRNFHGQFEITCLMVSEIYNKTHRGAIFKCGKDAPPEISKSKMTASLKSRMMKVSVENGNEEDSGYEST
ncbi:unnamed protein product [Caenorhabditis angaria]|uniref:Uncharacterized protein n=1 Tax=Caenorhabditis angaria TaxID=860376 RepID=A0A9P1N6A9_9PELO|nr:unnamed protein product [Caenorhabditis angaria]